MNKLIFYIVSILCLTIVLNDCALADNVNFLEKIENAFYDEITRLLKKFVPLIIPLFFVLIVAWIISRFIKTRWYWD
ncbi:MAG: hypothetical protein AB8B67_01495 [Rickettsiaceae bacterium]